MSEARGQIATEVAVPSDRFFAHTLPGRPPEEWEPLREHLEAVADLAARFAGPFGAGDWARVAGLWHDLGKYSAAFQCYLHLSTVPGEGDGGPDPHRAEIRGRVDHSSIGAKHAVAQLDLPGHLLAFVIAGHHAGLLDARGTGASLEKRLAKPVDPCGAAPADLRGALRELAVPSNLARALGERDAFAVAFFTRMLFSCLVDADFLCTERFCAPERAASRPAWAEDVLEQFEQALTAHLVDLHRQSPDTLVNQARREVLAACRGRAGAAPGLFSLTVPTGGGKTLSSLAFALAHARERGLRRVLYVIPFTSIIEQTANVFRAVSTRLVAAGNPEPVIEHHSNLAEENESWQSRLAAENWDAPLIVTTSVQFFESLFASRTSRCRRLHSLVGSVIILDEAQTLPVDLLEPCLRALRELVTGYGCSVVLCTATQPALGVREGFPIGLEGIREIAPSPARLYERLRRVAVRDLGQLGDEELAWRLADEPRVLAVVNTRGHARQLAELVGSRGGEVFHLSALMCPEHRSARLAEIRARLADSSATCRVVSTQLVEAGVDLDFPVVYRALAGIDAIAQAAGRCNREGRLAAPGVTYIFRPERRQGERYFRDTAQVAEQVLRLHEDCLTLEAVERFFRLYYWEKTDSWDERGILRELHLVQDRALPFLFGFATIAERFRLIDQEGRPVIVPWGSQGAGLCEELRRSADPPPAALLRRLQRYTVSIPGRVWEWERGRSFELVHEKYPILYSPAMHYSDQYGLVLEGAGDAFLEV